MSKTVQITSNEQLTSIIDSTKTVVIDFYAQWCPPCKAVAPTYEKLGSTLSSPGNIAFTKCDVDACKDVASKYNITAMPTFLIFQDKEEVDRIQGANVPALTQAIRKLVTAYNNSVHAPGSSSASGSSDPSGWCGAPIAAGYSDISQETEKLLLDILNASSSAGSIKNLLDNSEPGKNSEVKDWVESDTDEQIMIFIPFRSNLKVHSIHITSLPSSGDDEEEIGRPKKLKIYVNQPNIVGFDEAELITPTQEVEIASDSWDKKSNTIVVNTRFVKYQSVSSLTIFVEEGEDGCEKTRIDRIKIVGEAGDKRDMGKLEKVKDGLE